MRLHPDGHYTSEILDAHGVHHGFGTKAFRPAFGLPRTWQVHGSDVNYLESIDPDRLYIGDAWYTDMPDVVCYVRSADCLPVLLFDPATRLCAAVHAGWKGLAGGIVTNAVAVFVRNGASPAGIVAALGPCISACCYEVGPTLTDGFAKNGWDIAGLVLENNGATRFDLPKAAVRALISAGIKPANIDNSGICTFCNESEFHSFRRDGSEKGRQVNFISLLQAV